MSTSLRRLAFLWCCATHGFAAAAADDGLCATPVEGCGNAFAKGAEGVVLIQIRNEQQALLQTRKISGARVVSSEPPIFLAVLLRTGKKGKSPARVASIRNTWARALEPGALIELKPDQKCEEQYGDNHWEGLTCLEATNHLQLMNRTDFEWLLVVDDDVYVFVDRVRDTLRHLDSSRSEVYGQAGCGECGNGFKGMCGGGGYLLSRQSLLTMASAKAAPVSQAAGAAFLEHFMSPPQQSWCDVRFGCVAQEKGLTAVKVKGMYGNGITDANLTYDKAEEEKVAELLVREPPIVFHIVRDADHMERVYKEAMSVKANKTHYKSLEDWKDPY